MNVMNDIWLFVNDPLIMQELMTTKSTCIDKDGFLGTLLKPMLGDGMAFSSSTGHYKQKRKHCAHAFYKNHMYDM